MKRVWCLYRVSTKKQVNSDETIPVQKKACLDFVKQNPDWEITNELYERGVSAWKDLERDALVKIKEGAVNEEYDILLVFMFDRLGRREDETPYVVSFLNKHHVKVWSVHEGERSTDSHTDKLLNYLSSWLSDNESYKTSLRVRESKKQLSAQGFFQGGKAPTGYKIIETTQLHLKNKERYLKELAIDELESEIVKLIFNLYIERHMGYRKIVDYLNSKGHRNRDGKVFGVSTIKRILENPIYVGRKRYKSFDNETQEQPYKEELRIVTDDEFQQAMDIRNTRKEKIKSQDKTGIPLKGKLMFSGLAYCKYCGSKLSGNYLYRKQKYNNKEGHYTNIIYRYRCSTNKGKLDCNHERCIWGAKKYDKLIIAQVKEIIKKLDITSYVDSSKIQKKNKINQHENNVKNLEREYQKYSKQLDVLNREISKSLIGDSHFTPEQLSKSIKEIESIMSTKNKSITELEKEIKKLTADFSDINFMVNELNEWETKFDCADDDLKKAMLSRIIDKIYLGKDEVSIDSNILFEELLIT